MRTTIVIASVIAALAAGCGNVAAGGSTTPPGATARTGTVVGTYVLQSHLPHGRHAHPRGGVLIGVFHGRVPFGGPVRDTGPKMLARAVTDGSGHFTLAGLAPGRYYLMPRGVRELAPGRWVRVRAGEVAHVRLIGCADCPRPMIAAHN